MSLHKSQNITDTDVSNYLTDIESSKTKNFIPENAIQSQVGKIHNAFCFSFIINILGCPKSFRNFNSLFLE